MESYSEASLVCFAEFVETLGTQPVTVTISSILSDMLQAYENITRNLPKFSWDQDLHSAAEQFILTRECFYYSPNRAPVLEATFKLMHYHPDELDIEIQYTWNPPYIAFPGLCNVISEGTEYHLQPTIDSREHGSTKVTTEYF